MDVPATDVTPPGTRLRKVRGFPQLMAAFGISSLGDGIRTAALPLLALTITSDPLAISGIAIAGRLPWLFVALFSGAIADRYDRRHLMAAVDAARCLTVAALALFVFTGAESLILLYVTAIALTVGETLFDSAEQGLLPSVVPQDQLGRAYGNLFTTNLIGDSFVGPSLGSWLFTIGRAVPLVFDAITFAVSSVLLFFTRPARDTADDDGPSAPTGSLLREIGEGLTWIRGHELIRGFIMIVAVVNFTQSATQSVLVLRAVDDLGMSEWGFGILLTVGGIGAFAGGALSGRVGDSLGVDRILLPAVAVTPILFGLMWWTDSPVVLGAAIALNAFFGILANVQMIALRQRLVPNRLLGRVSSVSRFAGLGIAVPLGALAAGLLARAIDVRAVYLASAIVVIVLLALVGRRLVPARLRVAMASEK
jgi:MFS family permease